MKRKSSDSPTKRKFGVSVSPRELKSKSYVTVTFGDVTIAGNRPSAESIKAHVDRSTDALARVGKKLTKPGVTLSKKKGIPRFSVDENDPTIFVRVLDGQVDRGRMVNGEFEPVG
ncbi:hypothetical protein [Agrobacterium larrymoorei]|uniref:Uncharacterized protein n=1 Tax=Agrobacterium larrymoorei TaxID=160699 RepID=A0A4D7E0V5_9HYPH|nr:hypothetical protein [Agrobacterium larrymoorei]QCJ00900.1 hypothetical protein CFBP5473_23155 [Agrobacterium larrymoorei]QYA10236.1 hypothetical protein J5285_23825 [Agrobacterium larrymoorei]